MILYKCVPSYPTPHLLNINNFHISITYKIIIPWDHVNKTYISFYDRKLPSFGFENTVKAFKRTYMYIQSYIVPHLQGWAVKLSAWSRQIGGHWFSLRSQRSHSFREWFPRIWYDFRSETIICIYYESHYNIKSIHQTYTKIYDIELGLINVQR